MVVAASLLSCMHSDRITAPTRSASPRRQLNADLIGTGSCGATCVLFENSDPLWSAVANPDSAAAPVSIADVRFAPSEGDSVVLQLTGDSAVLVAISANELLDVTDSASHASLSLAALSSARVVWRFASSDSTTLHVTLNRALGNVVSGSLGLTASTSASVVSAIRPWIASLSGSSGLQMSAIRPLGIHRANDLMPACSGDVRASGPFCGGSGFALFTPEPVSADAFGAAFQSPPHGHGVSTPLTVTFIPPVASVTVKCDDPTFNGNQMEAFDIHHVSLGVVKFPGNGRPGTNEPQSGTISGAIKYLVLTPAAADYVAYTMTVTLASPASLTISSAAGPRAGGSFTSADTENTLTLSATANGFASPPQIRWDVANDSTYPVVLQHPNSVTGGLNSATTVPTQSVARYDTTFIGPHPVPLNRLALRFVVTATATSEQPNVVSAPVTVVQSEVDALREEYFEYRIKLPDPSWFTQSATRGPPFTIDALNFGDYSWSVVDPTLPGKLRQIQTLAGRTLRLTSGYRDPMHYWWHVKPSGGQPHHLFSPHQYGIAADIDTGRDDTRWTSLRVNAWHTTPAACVEPMAVSTNNHLHVDYDRLPTIGVACPDGWHP